MLTAFDNVLEISLIFTLGLLVLAFIGLRMMRRLQKQLRSSKLLLSKELQAIRSGSIGMGKRLRMLEKKLHLTSERTQELECKDIGNITYTHANQLVRMGAESEEIVNTCGLSYAEANLVTLMHNQKNKAAA